MTGTLEVLIGVVLVVVVFGAVFVTRGRTGRPSSLAGGTSSLKSPVPAAPTEESHSEDVPSTTAVTPDAPSVVTSKRPKGFLGEALARMRSQRALGEGLWDELEEALLLSDVGLEVTESILSAVRARVRSEGVTDPMLAVEILQQEMALSLEGAHRAISMAELPPTVILFVGVNGVGKTTSIGKVAAKLTTEGSKVVLAAGDTFRAAATEQLERWSERAGVPLVKGVPGGDPSSVIYDAISHATAIGADVVLADTAGRLQNRFNLMEELKKIRRVAEKASGTVTEVLLVLDATTGQNGLAQARGFSDAAGVTGVVLTKLDGSAKGGVAFAIERELGIPIKLIGVGEGIHDLEPFDPVVFVRDITSTTED